MTPDFYCNPQHNISGKKTTLLSFGTLAFLTTISGVGLIVDSQLPPKINHATKSIEKMMKDKQTTLFIGIAMLCITALIGFAFAVPKSRDFLFSESRERNMSEATKLLNGPSYR